MNQVWVRHPVLGTEVEVPESAIPIMRQSGWEPLVQKEQAAKERQLVEDAAAAEKAMQEKAAATAATNEGAEQPARTTPKKENG